MILCSSATTGNLRRASCTSGDRSTGTLYARLVILAVLVASSGGRGSTSSGLGLNSDTLMEVPLRGGVSTGWSADGTNPKASFLRCEAQALNADVRAFLTSIYISSPELDSSSADVSEVACPSSSSDILPVPSSISEPASSCEEPPASDPVLNPSHSGSAGDSRVKSLPLVFFRFLTLMMGRPSSSTSSGRLSPIPKATVNDLDSAIDSARDSVSNGASSLPDSFSGLTARFIRASSRSFSFSATSMPARRSWRALDRISRFESVTLPSCFELRNRLVSTLCCASFLMSSRFSSFFSLVSCTSNERLQDSTESNTPYNVLVQSFLLLAGYLRLLRSQCFSQLPASLLPFRLGSRQYLRSIRIAGGWRNMCPILPLSLTSLVLALARNELWHLGLQRRGRGRALPGFPTWRRKDHVRKPRR